MKKVLIVFIALLASVSIFAQDMESATNMYNEGATALNMGDKETALKCFQEALSQAEMIGGEAEELMYNCKKNIPVLIMSIGKEKANNNDIAGAIATFEQAIEKAEEYGQTDVVVEAESLIPQLYMQEGNVCLKNKDYQGALNAYNKVIEINPNDSNAYLRIGQAASRLNDNATAMDAYNKSIELGNKNATKEIAKLYLTMANGELKAKNYQEALDHALKSNEIAANPTAMQIAGTAALALKNYTAAIENFEGFIAANPTAKNADQIRYQLATSYEATGDKANACVNYKAILSNPQFKEFATHKVNVELKCQ